jgi:hypothetical protein
MSNLIPNTLRKMRNLFLRLGIQPPFWLIRLGRHWYHAFSSAPSVTPVVSNDAYPLNQLEAKIDHLIWQNERIEASLYLISLQPPASQGCPQNKLPEPTTKAAHGASAEL